MTELNRESILRNSDFYGQYRLATEDDIVPGAHLHMASVKWGPSERPFPVSFPFVIVIDEMKISEHYKVMYLYWKDHHNNECFAPLSSFMGNEPDTCGPDATTLLLVKK